MGIKPLIQPLLIGLAVLAGAEASLYTSDTLSAATAPKQPPGDHSGHQPAPTLAVTHRVVGNDLQLELKVTRFTFSLDNMGKDNRYGEGHVHLYLDGKKVAKIFASSYTYPDIPPGKHQVEVELAHNNHESYGVKQSFTIEVQ